MSDPNRDGSPPLAPAGPRGLNASGMSTASVGLNDTTETSGAVPTGAYTAELKPMMSNLFREVDSISHDNAMLKHDAERYKSMLMEERRVKSRAKESARKMRLERDHLANRLTVLTREAEALKTENDELHRKHTDTTNKMIRLQNDDREHVAVLEERIDELTEDLERAKRKSEALKYNFLFDARRQVEEEKEQWKEEMAEMFGAENRRKAAELDALKAELEERLRQGEQWKARTGKLDFGFKKVKSELMDAKERLRQVKEARRTAETERLRLQAELAELQSRYHTDIPKWRSKYNKESKEREHLASVNAKLSHSLERARAKMGALKVQVKTLLQERIQQEREGLDLQVTVTRLNGDISEANDTIEQLRSESSRTQSLLEEAKNTTAHYKEATRIELRELKRKVKVSEAARATAQQEKLDLQVQVSRLTDEVDNHRADRERTAAERDAIKAQHSNLAEATSEFEGRLMDLQNENQRLTRLRDEVKKEYIDATSRLQAEARVAQEQAERATAAKEAAEATAAAAQEALAKCEHDVAAAEVARETAAKAQAIAEQELKETRDRHAHSHSTHRQTQSEQEETIERLRTEIAEMREASRSREVDLTHEVEVLTSQAESLRSQAQQDKLDLERQIQRLENEREVEVARLEAKVLQEGTARSEAESERRQLKKDNLALSHRLEEETEERTRAERRNETLAAELDDLRASHGVMQSTKTSVSVELETTQVELMRLRRDCDKANALSEGLQAERDALTARVATLEASIESLRADHTTAHEARGRELAEARALKEHHEGQATHYEGELRSHKTELAASQAALSTAEKKIESLERTVARLENSVEGFDAERETMRREIQRLRAERDDIRAATGTSFDVSVDLGGSGSLPDE